MASLKFDGLEDFINLCIFTDKQLDKVIGRTIYPGGRVMSSAIQASMQTIKTDDSYWKNARKYGRKIKPSSRQLKALIESYGIAKIRKNKFGYNVKCGFDGYNDIVSERWPNGQPNAMIARSINKGTSFMEAQPFMDTAVSSAEGATVEAMKNQFDHEIEKIWNK